jgi:hypothetical protein
MMSESMGAIISERPGDFIGIRSERPASSWKGYVSKQLRSIRLVLRMLRMQSPSRWGIDEPARD